MSYVAERRVMIAVYFTLNHKDEINLYVISALCSSTSQNWLSVFILFELGRRVRISSASSVHKW